MATCVRNVETSWSLICQKRGEKTKQKKQGDGDICFSQDAACKKVQSLCFFGIVGFGVWIAGIGSHILMPFSKAYHTVSTKVALETAFRHNKPEKTPRSYAFPTKSYIVVNIPRKFRQRSRPSKPKNAQCHPCKALTASAFSLTSEKSLQHYDPHPNLFATVSQLFSRRFPTCPKLFPVLNGYPTCPNLFPTFSQPFPNFLPTFFPTFPRLIVELGVTIFLGSPFWGGLTGNPKKAPVWSPKTDIQIEQSFPMPLFAFDAQVKCRSIMPASEPSQPAVFRPRAASFRISRVVQL